MPMNKPIIGRAEYLYIVSEDIKNVPARIDTGAKTSAIWATSIKEKNGVLEYKLFGPSSKLFTNVLHTTKDYSRTVVSSSNGKPQPRFKTTILVEIAGKRIKAKFTLADRSRQVYPVLVGRSMLMGKFLVDVKEGSPLSDEEEARTRELRKQLTDNKEMK